MKARVIMLAGVLAIAGCGRAAAPMATGTHLLSARATDEALVRYVSDFYHLMFDFIDTSHDGRIDWPEADAKAFTRQAFDQMDLDHDGFWSFDELVPPRDIPNGVRIVRDSAASFFPDLDPDGNGQIAASEYQAKLDTFRSPLAVETLPHLKADAFKLADEDGDGTLGPDEFETVCGYILSKGYRYTTIDRRPAPLRPAGLWGKVPALTR